MYYILLVLIVQFTLCCGGQGCRRLLHNNSFKTSLAHLRGYTEYKRKTLLMDE